VLSREKAEFDPARLFPGWNDLPGLLLAVSGGPDSMALLRLAARWRACGARVPLFVATVDHGLRPESAAEAAQVGAWARELTLPHATLVWRGARPQTAVQARARAARHQLLFAHALEIGAVAVATAHHADDQWETILLRLARGSGLNGLAGMAREQNFHGGRVIRPLLGLTKQALVDFCRAEGQAFFDDPSNANPVYARARLRALAGPLRAFGLTNENLQKLADRAEKAEAALDGAARDFFARAHLAPGEYDLAVAASPPLAIFERFLALAAAEVAGAPPSRLERIESLALRLHAALEAGAPCRATLGGCLVRLGPKKKLKLSLEKPRNRGNSIKL
jgi:tRNA(Ile)-lysidine synthase